MVLRVEPSSRFSLGLGPILVWTRLSLPTVSTPSAQGLFVPSSLRVTVCTLLTALMQQKYDGVPLSALVCPRLTSLLTKCGALMFLFESVCTTPSR